MTAVGAGIYAGRVEGRADAAERAIMEVKALESDRDAVLRVIDERLSRIEGAVGAPHGPPLSPGARGKRR